MTHKFTIFPLLVHCCKKGFDNLDTPPSNQECDLCGDPGDPCGDCLLCLSPFGLVLDIVSCPFRCLHHYTRCKSPEVPTDNVVSVVTIQPN